MKSFNVGLKKFGAMARWRGGAKCPIKNSYCVFALVKPP